MKNKLRKYKFFRNIFNIIELLQKPKDSKGKIEITWKWQKNKGTFSGWLVCVEEVWYSEFGQVEYANLIVLI